MEVKLMCGDGFAGREYYMLLNGIRIEIVLNQGDHEEAKKRTIEIFQALKIDYEEEIEFKHDGRM